MVGTWYSLYRSLNFSVYLKMFIMLEKWEKLHLFKECPPWLYHRQINSFKILKITWGMTYWYFIQHGLTLKTLSCVKEARHRGLPFAIPLTWNVQNRQPHKTGSEVVVARGREEQMVTAKRYGFFKGVVKKM